MFLNSSSVRWQIKDNIYRTHPSSYFFFNTVFDSWLHFLVTPYLQNTQLLDCWCGQPLPPIGLTITPTCQLIYVKIEAISKIKAVGTHVIMWTLGEISEWNWSYRKEKLYPNTRSISTEILIIHTGCCSQFKTNVVSDSSDFCFVYIMPSLKQIWSLILRLVRLMERSVIPGRS